MLAVRTKIASEFAEDLDLIIAANKEILASYNDKCMKAREDEKDKKGQVEDDEDGCAIKPVQGGSMSGDFNFGQRTTQTFERGAVYMINNHPNFNNPESTLLRSTSFDLLFLLSTQESIHRVLKSYKKAGEEKEVSFSWLLEYYNNSLDKYFDGNQSFGRADDFLDDLLLTPPSLKTIDNNIGFIDPLMIAEEIIKVREEVAKEWKNLMTLVPHDQEKIRQAVFVKLMAKWGNPVVETASESKKEDNERVNQKSDEESKETGEIFANTNHSSEAIKESGVISEEIEESVGEIKESGEIFAKSDENDEEGEEKESQTDEVCAEIDENEELVEEIEEEIFVEEFSLFSKLAERMFGIKEKETEQVEIIGEFE